MRLALYWLSATGCALGINVWLQPPWWAGIAVAAVVSMVVDMWVNSIFKR